MSVRIKQYGMAILNNCQDMLIIIMQYSVAGVHSGWGMCLLVQTWSCHTVDTVDSLVYCYAPVMFKMVYFISQQRECCLVVSTTL